MGDFLSKTKRSEHMSKIRAKNTGIERIMFRLLKRKRVYFAAHASALPGRPDIVFRRCKLAVFIDGDFWHGRNLKAWESKLDDFWKAKIKRNIERDREKDRKLRALGWRVLHLWGTDIKRDPEKCVDKVLAVRERLLRLAESGNGTVKNG